MRTSERLYCPGAYQSNVSLFLRWKTPIGRPRLNIVIGNGSKEG